MSDLELALELLKVKKARSAMVDPKKSGLSITVDGQKSDVSAYLESAFVARLDKYSPSAIDPLIDYALEQIHDRLIARIDQAKAELRDFNLAIGIGWKPPQHDQAHDLRDDEGMERAPEFLKEQLKKRPSHAAK